MNRDQKPVCWKWTFFSLVWSEGFPSPWPKSAARLSTHVLIGNLHDAWHSLRECPVLFRLFVFVFFLIKVNLQLSSQVVSMMIVSSFDLRWISNQSMTLTLETLDGFKAAASDSDLQFHVVFAPWGSLQPLHQTVAAPIVVGSSFLSPELERLGKSKRAPGEPKETQACPTPQWGVIKVADREKTKTENCKDRYTKKRRTAFKVRLTKQNLQLCQQISSICLACIRPSAPWGLGCVTLMKSAMGN